MLGALALFPLAAGADAVAPEPDLRLAPLLTFQAPDRVQLSFRLDRALTTRFDGEVLGRVRISGRGASLYPVGAAGSNCYAARVPPGPMLTPRRYTVRLFLGERDQQPLELTVPLRRALRGDARGKRLGCG